LWSGLSLKTNDSSNIGQAHHTANNRVDVRRTVLTRFSRIVELGEIERREKTRRGEQRRGKQDEEMRGTIVVLYMALVDVYVHRMKMVASGILRPSAYAKRISIRVSSSSVSSSVSVPHPCLSLVDHTSYQ
jgi:hypothetical protein